MFFKMHKEEVSSALMTFLKEIENYGIIIPYQDFENILLPNTTELMDTMQFMRNSVFSCEDE